MSTIVTLADFISQQEYFANQALQNKIFVYPTDTVYGIGTVYSQANLTKINNIKNRPANQLCSILAPDFDWIIANYKEAKSIQTLKKYQSKYHGVTYIFNPDQPGVRVIDHPFQKFVKTLGVAFITTSANISGNPVIKNIDQLSPKLMSKVDYIIDGGVLDGKPSVLINLPNGTVLER